MLKCNPFIIGIWEEITEFQSFMIPLNFSVVLCIFRSCKLKEQQTHMEKSKSNSYTTIDPVLHEVVKRFDARRKDFQCTQLLGKVICGL